MRAQLPGRDGLSALFRANRLRNTPETCSPVRHDRERRCFVSSVPLTRRKVRSAIDEFSDEDIFQKHLKQVGEPYEEG